MVEHELSLGLSRVPSEKWLAISEKEERNGPVSYIEINGQEGMSSLNMRGETGWQERGGGNRKNKMVYGVGVASISRGRGEGIPLALGMKASRRLHCDGNVYGKVGK